MSRYLKKNNNGFERSKPARLKARVKQSHNDDSMDKRIIALVKLLARRAAEEDYQIFLNDAHMLLKDNKGGD